MSVVNKPREVLNIYERPTQLRKRIRKELLKGSRKTGEKFLELKDFMKEGLESEGKPTPSGFPQTGL